MNTQRLWGWGGEAQQGLINPSSLVQQLCVSARWELLSANPRSARNFQAELDSLRASRLRLHSQSSHICGPGGTRRGAEAAGDESRTENVRFCAAPVPPPADFTLELKVVLLLLLLPSFRHHRHDEPQSSLDSSCLHLCARRIWQQLRSKAQQ